MGGGLRLRLIRPTRYTPDKGYTGKDVYIFKICATKGALKGCSAVGFVPEVK